MLVLVILMSLLLIAMSLLVIPMSLLVVPMLRLVAALGHRRNVTVVSLLFSKCSLGGDNYFRNAIAWIAVRLTTSRL